MKRYEIVNSVGRPWLLFARGTDDKSWIVEQSESNCGTRIQALRTRSSSILTITKNDAIKAAISLNPHLTGSRSHFWFCLILLSFQTPASADKWLIRRILSETLNSFNSLTALYKLVD